MSKYAATPRMTLKLALRVFAEVVIGLPVTSGRRVRK